MMHPYGPVLTHLDQLASVVGMTSRQVASCLSCALAISAPLHCPYPHPYFTGTHECKHVNGVVESECVECLDRCEYGLGFTRLLGY